MLGIFDIKKITRSKWYIDFGVGETCNFFLYTNCSWLHKWANILDGWNNNLKIISQWFQKMDNILNI